MPRQFRKQAVDLPDSSKVLTWTPDNGDTRTLKLHEQVVKATIANGVTATLNLPNCLEAEGLIFSIFAVDGTGSVTVSNGNGSIDWSDLTVDATNDAVILKAQGGKWWAVDNEIS